MGGQKRFGTSFFGFKKSDVNSYLEKMLKEFENRLDIRKNEIESLKNENKDLRNKYDDLFKRSAVANEIKAKVANVLLSAQDKADRMIEDARTSAMEEKRIYEEQVEQQKEKLVEMKQKVKFMRDGIINTMQQFESGLIDKVDLEFDEKEYHNPNDGVDEIIEKALREAINPTEI